MTVPPLLCILSWPELLSSYCLLVCSSGPLGPDLFQQHAGGFVFWVLRHGSPWNALASTAWSRWSISLRALVASGCEVVDPAERRFNAANDFPLFGQRNFRQAKIKKFGLGQVEAAITDASLHPLWHLDTLRSVQQ